MLKLSKISKAAIIASISTLAFSSFAFAQQAASTADSVGIEVSSPIYEYTVKPGDNQQDIIKLKNAGKSSQTYYPLVLDFKSDNKSGTPIFLKANETNGTYSLKEWINVSKEGIKLDAGQSTALNFYVSVPADAEPGGHYGGILFSTQAPEASGGTISISSMVGSLVLVRVAGDAKESATITNFATDKESYEVADVKFNLEVKNTGTVHLQPKGVITIKNFFGGQVASADVNQLSANVLPGSSRIFNAAWKDPGFKVGYYTATADLNYGNPSQTVTAQVSFWVLPWKTLLVLLVLLILLIVATYFAIKKYNQWIISKARNQK